MDPNAGRPDQPPGPPPPGWGAPPPPPPPGYGAPPPGYGGPPGYGAPPGWGPSPPGYPTGTNQKAVWALVCGIVGLCCGIVGIVAIILGNQAKSEIQATGQGGLGMAQAGFVLGIVDLVLGVLWFTVRLSAFR
jgi:hypothetical protein